MVFHSYSRRGVEGPFTTETTYILQNVKLQIYYLSKFVTLILLACQFYLEFLNKNSSLMKNVHNSLFNPRLCLFLYYCIYFGRVKLEELMSPQIIQNHLSCIILDYAWVCCRECRVLYLLSVIELIIRIQSILGKKDSRFYIQLFRIYMYQISRKGYMCPMPLGRIS